MCLAALQAQTQHFLPSSSFFSHHLSLFLTFFLSASQTFSCWQSTYSTCAKRTGGAYTNTAAASSSPLSARPRQTQSGPNGWCEFNFACSFCLKRHGFLKRDYVSGDFRLFFKLCRNDPIFLFVCVCVCSSRQGGSPGAYDRSFRWKYHQFRFLCHVSN